MPIQTHQFDSAICQDPVGDLTLLVKGLRIGERVQLEDGTVVRSVGIDRGAHKERRFAIVPPGSALDRHRRLVLGHGACTTAEQAALKALGKDK